MALNQLPEVTSVHEPKPMLINLAHARMMGESPEQDLKELRPDLPEHYVESALWNTWLIEDILDLWPDAKFVWLQRDLLTWAYSAYRRGWYDEKAEAERQVKMDMIRPQPGQLQSKVKSTLPIPENGWPLKGTPEDGKPASRWFKLGHMYRLYHEQISLTFSEVRAPMVIFNMRDLSDVMRLNGLVRWAGLPGTVQNGEHVNKGELYVSAKELMKAGLDASPFGEKLGWETPLSVHMLCQQTPWPKWKLEAIAKENRVQVKLTIEAVQDLMDGVSWIP